jgi:site-specific recombinase XerD
MHNAIAAIPSVDAQIATLDSQVRESLLHTRSANTRKAQASDLRRFTAFASSLGLDAADATTAARYLAHLDAQGAATATIRRHASSLQTCIPSTAHPAVTALLDGITRARAAQGAAPQRQAAALAPADLAAMLRALPATLAGLRNRALLLLGFTIGCREAELVALSVADLAFDAQRGLLVNIRQSKTDQHGHGRLAVVPYGLPSACPVAAVRAWLQAASITSGPVLRSVSRHGTVGGTLSTRAIDGIIQAAAAAAGIQQHLTGHSLRAGLVTAAFDAGVPEADIMRQTGHRSVATLRRYRRTLDAWQSNAAAPVLQAIR